MAVQFPVASPNIQIIKVMARQFIKNAAQRSDCHTNRRITWVKISQSQLAWHDRHIIQTRTNTRRISRVRERDSEREIKSERNDGWAVIRQFHMNKLAGNAA